MSHNDTIAERDYYKRELAAARARVLQVEVESERLREALEEFGVHDRECARSYFEAGEPTPDGGYREKIKGVWYQTKPIDETPKCNCGLAEALTHPEPHSVLDELRLGYQKRIDALVELATQKMVDDAKTIKAHVHASNLEAVRKFAEKIRPDLIARHIDNDEQRKFDAAWNTCATQIMGRINTALAEAEKEAHDGKTV